MHEYRWLGFFIELLIFSIRMIKVRFSVIKENHKLQIYTLIVSQ